MNRILLLALTVGLLSPTAANAQRDEVRHICASRDARELTPKQALRKLGLKVPKDNPDSKLFVYCQSYRAN